MAKRTKMPAPEVRHRHYGGYTTDRETATVKQVMRSDGTSYYVTTYEHRGLLSSDSVTVWSDVSRWPPTQTIEAPGEWTEMDGEGAAGR